MEPGTSAWKKIRDEFGEEVLLPSGKLNREKLGEIIFANPEKRRKLNEWTHPEIHRTIMFEVLKYFLAGSNQPDTKLHYLSQLLVCSTHIVSLYHCFVGSF